MLSVQPSKPVRCGPCREGTVKGAPASEAGQLPAPLELATWDPARALKAPQGALVRSFFFLSGCLRTQACKGCVRTLPSRPV